MRWPSWRSCSKSAEASAMRSVSTSLWRFFRNTGMRSSRSFATMTLCLSPLMSPRIIGGPPRRIAVRLCQRSVKVARGGRERTQQRAVIEQSASDEMHHLAFALDDAGYAEQTRAEQLAALALDQMPPDH